MKGPRLPSVYLEMHGILSILYHSYTYDVSVRWCGYRSYTTVYLSVLIPRIEPVFYSVFYQKDRPVMIKIMLAVILSYLNHLSQFSRQTLPRLKCKTNEEMSCFHIILTSCCIYTYLWQSVILQATSESCINIYVDVDANYIP